MTPRSLLIGGLLIFAVVAGSSRGVSLEAQVPAKPEPVAEQALVDKYCVTCHNARTLSGYLSLAGLGASKARGSSRHLRKGRARQCGQWLMPTNGVPVLNGQVDGFAGAREKLDRQGTHTNPGVTSARINGRLATDRTGHWN